jgi:hypothetical protein
MKITSEMLRKAEEIQVEVAVADSKGRGPGYETKNSKNKDHGKWTRKDRHGRDTDDFRYEN